MSTLRMIWVLTLLHAKQASRSNFEIATAMITPVIQATLAVYLFKAGSEPHKLLEASVGAGLMGVWSSVLFGSGGAIQRHRFQGTLESLIMAPRNPALTILPVTIAHGLTGTYAMIGTLVWGKLLYGVQLDFASPWLFLVAAPACVLGLGMFGLLLAATFVLMRNANALCNTLEYPIWLVSGMLVPMTVLPAWASSLADLLPTTWGARAVQQAVSGGPVWGAIGWCLGISLLCFTLGAVSMSFVERRARAAATLALA